MARALWLKKHPAAVCSLVGTAPGRDKPRAAPLPGSKCESLQAFSPPVDPSKALAELSSNEMQAFCDWTNQKEGGYGRVIECEASGVPLETDPDQATCVAELARRASEPSCSATVGQWTMCFEWLLGNWCNTMPSMMPAECASIQTTCYGSGGLPDGGGD
jgi:hypothetical protein